MRGRAAAEPDGREQRKIVTVLFCDVVAYTALGESIDLEVTRVFLARYFGAMKAAVECFGEARRTPLEGARDERDWTSCPVRWIGLAQRAKLQAAVS